MKLPGKSKHIGFTLVEILVVLIVVGMLAIALISKIKSTQERARDAARSADMTTVTTAVELYFADFGAYPVAPFWSAITRRFASTTIRPLLASEMGGGNSSSNINGVASSLRRYLATLPTDKGKGLTTTPAGFCTTQGDYFAYYTDSSGSFYAITSLKESKKGNTTACRGSMDSDAGKYLVVGKGLYFGIGYFYPDSSAWTPSSCFTFSNGTISSFNSSCGNEIVIPKIINGNTVTAIQGNAFVGKGLQGVILPDSIVSIGGYAFYDNKIESIAIPNSVTSIGAYAFEKNQIRYVLLPETLTNIGQSAFKNNDIISIKIPDTVTNIGPSAFLNNNLSSITFPAGLTTIGSDAFYSNNIQGHVTIPDSVVSIGINAFYNNQITSVTLSNSLTTLGQSAFQDNELTSVTLPDSVTNVYHSVFYRNKLSGPGAASIPAALSFPAGAFGSCNEVNGCVVRRP